VRAVSSLLRGSSSAGDSTSARPARWCEISTRPSWMSSTESSSRPAWS
jgi:hypothetical protein